MTWITAFLFPTDPSFSTTYWRVPLAPARVCFPAQPFRASSCRGCSACRSSLSRASRSCASTCSPDTPAPAPTCAPTAPSRDATIKINTKLWVKILSVHVLVSYHNTFNATRMFFLIRIYDLHLEIIRHIFNQ